jgi:hypothetical protein
VIVLLGGPKKLDGRCLDVISNARGFEHIQGFEATFEWIDGDKNHRYLFSFKENGNSYYIHESEVILNG